MANCVCGGMKTLGVAMGQPGRTDQIIADTWQCVDPLKPKFTDKEPSIKLDAPVITEIVDLPATTYPMNLRGVHAKWVIDVIMSWDGRFDETATNMIKGIAIENNQAEWSAQWTGKYDDIVSGLIATKMKLGLYNELPAPFKPKEV